MIPTPNFELRSEEFLVNPGTAERLDRFCGVMEMLQSGADLPDGSSLVNGLVAIANVYGEAPTAVGGACWNAQYSPSLSGNGGTLSIKEQAGTHGLVVSRDRNGALYNGIWSRLDENDSLVLLFDVVNSPSGYQLKVSGGDLERMIPLGQSLPGFQWASTDDVANFIPEWMKAGLEAVRSSVQAQPVQPDQPVQPISEPAPMAAKVFCGTCGATLQPGIRFCPQCAAPVQPTVSPIVVNPPSQLAAVLYLVCQTDGKIIPLVDGLSIGRGSDNILRLDDSQLSRRHAMIEQVDGGWQLQDLNSTNGVKLNGKWISSPVPLKAGDLIEMGTSRLNVEMR